MARHHRFAAWLGGIALAASIHAAVRADTLPWQGDFPQTHGPGGTVLVDHQPSNVGGFGADTLFADFPGSERCADDFSITQAAIINRIVWWGFYDLNILPSTDDTFRIRVYDQRPGDLLPGLVLYEQSFSSVPRAWTGRFVLTFGAPREFRYEVDLPFSLNVNTNTTYWLEIAQIGDVNSFFRWEASNFPPMNGQAVINPIVGDWFAPQSVVSNTAFQLISVPEPCSLTFVALAGIAVISRRRRRWS